MTKVAVNVHWIDEHGVRYLNAAELEAALRDIGWKQAADVVKAFRLANPSKQERIYSGTK